MKGMFANATNFNKQLNKWDTKNVINLSQMFYNAINFNQPLDNKWNTSNVIYLNEMFSGATLFNQPLIWKTDRAITMAGMFFSSGLNKSITFINAKQVTSVMGMFARATNFNSPVILYDTESLTDVSQMFLHATSFNKVIRPVPN